jgi:hypothetical protein
MGKTRSCQSTLIVQKTIVYSLLLRFITNVFSAAPTFSENIQSDEWPGKSAHSQFFTLCYKMKIDSICLEINFHNVRSECKYRKSNIINI